MDQHLIRLFKQLERVQGDGMNDCNAEVELTTRVETHPASNGSLSTEYLTKRMLTTRSGSTVILHVNSPCLEYGSGNRGDAMSPLLPVKSLP